jgi:hypothetical protein
MFKREIKFTTRKDGVYCEFIVSCYKYKNKVVNFLFRLKSEEFDYLALDYGYHSRTKMYDFQTIYQKQSKKHKCPYTKGRCYYDGTSIGADETMKELFEYGSDYVFEKMEESFKQTFINKENI